MRSHFLSTVKLYQIRSVVGKQTAFSVSLRMLLSRFGLCTYMFKTTRAVNYEYFIFHGVYLIWDFHLALGKQLRQSDSLILWASERSAGLKSWA